MFHVKQTGAAQSDLTFHVKQSTMLIRAFDFRHGAPYIRRHVHVRA